MDTQTLTINTSEVPVLEKTGQTILDSTSDMVITTPDEHQQASDILKIIKDKSRVVEDARKRITAPLDEAKRQVMALFNRPLALLQQAEANIKTAVVTYTREVERKRQEEEARLREIARKEKERLLELAREAEKSGDHAAADNLAGQYLSVTVPTVVAPTPKASGLAMKKVWQVTVTDKAALIKACAEGKVSADALEPTTTFLRPLATTAREQINVPGVVAEQVDQVAVR